MIDQDIPIEAPGGFAPVLAMGLDDGAGRLAVVGVDRPLPTVAAAPAVPPALDGSTAQPLLAGPYHPAPFSPVFLTLSGAWTGKVTVVRSSDGGESFHPLTAGGVQWASYQANCCEPVWSESEAGAALYLDIAPTSGTIAFRVSQ